MIGHREWEKREIEDHAKDEPKYCPHCGRKLWKKEVLPYIGDEGFNSCKQKIYYDIDCRRCKKYTKMDGPSI